jgi:hypothetical protein
MHRRRRHRTPPSPRSAVPPPATAADVRLTPGHDPGSVWFEPAQHDHTPRDARAIDSRVLHWKFRTRRRSNGGAEPGDLRGMYVRGTVP